MNFGEAQNLHDISITILSPYECHEHTNLTICAGISPGFICGPSMTSFTVDALEAPVAASTTLRAAFITGRARVNDAASSFFSTGRTVP